VPKGFEATKKSQMLAISVRNVSVSIFGHAMFQPGWLSSAMMQQLVTEQLATMAGLRKWAKC